MRLKGRPVAALELMVELYLDPEIASPRKVSVWYSFWGEASSRQEYYDICGKKDEDFASLVRDLIERLIVETSQPQLDPDGIALGLIGVLEMLWQDFAFRTEADIDRAAAKRRAMAYLRSVFPGQFSLHEGAGAAPVRDKLAGWVYASGRLFAAERESLFQGTWQFAGHQAQIPEKGDFLSVDLGIERALLVRNSQGAIRAFRNSCSETPHVLVAPARGRLSAVRCAVHGLEFDLDGRRRGTRGTTDLVALELRMIGDLMLVRTAATPRAAARIADSWAGFSPAAPSRLIGAPTDTTIAADWKLVIEQWLEAAGGGASRDADPQGWSARAYEGILGSAANFSWQRRFMMPNHGVEVRPDGFSIFQVLPLAPGRCVIRRHDFTLCDDERAARAAACLALRLNPSLRPAALALAETTQKGIVSFGHAAADGVEPSPAVAAFRRELIARVPMMALSSPPHEL
jgi:phenylpropionate dioxygenase-like ring-hydroxylating dioxygenase large terminal subunit